MSSTAPFVFLLAYRRSFGLKTRFKRPLTKLAVILDFLAGYDKLVPVGSGMDAGGVADERSAAKKLRPWTRFIRRRIRELMSMRADDELHAMLIEERTPIFGAQRMKYGPFNFRNETFSLLGSVIVERNVTERYQERSGCYFWKLERLIKPRRLKFPVRFGAGNTLKFCVRVFANLRRIQRDERHRTVT